jgi:hypothetical protein
MRDEWASAALAELNKAREEYNRRCRPGPLGCYSLNSEDHKSEHDRDRAMSQREYQGLGIPEKICVKGRPKGTEKPFVDLDDYIAFRNAFFGSAADYWQFALVSDREFQENRRLLISQLPNPWKKRRSIPAAASQWHYYYYRWLRRAYIVDGTPAEDVIDVIKGGLDPEMVAKLKQVRAVYKLIDPGATLTASPFVPRAMKTPHRLGTVSNHGYGTALDINSADNPDLNRQTWQKLKNYAGKPTIDRSESRYWSDPKALWSDIHELNRLVVEKTRLRGDAAWAVAKVQNAADPKRAKSEADVRKKSRKEAAATVDLGNDKLLDGFFTLDWELVVLLHGQGFKWGATFSNTVDLHHFEPTNAKARKHRDR